MSMTVPRMGRRESLEKISTADPRVVLLELSRNFGHQAALTAGLDHALGDVVITMDGDGQHPPRMIPELLRLVEQGYDIVQTQRLDAEQKNTFKKWTSGWFYALLNSLSGTQVKSGAADFRAMSRQAVDALKVHAGVSPLPAGHGVLDRILHCNPSISTA